MKYILVSGGVISGVGKGVITSSIGTLLKSVGLKVTAIKIDPYLNINAGTFSPYEHGEWSTSGCICVALALPPSLSSSLPSSLPPSLFLQSPIFPDETTKRQSPGLPVLCVPRDPPPPGVEEPGLSL